ncbi:hypothetical protein, partial [Plasmodium yoelii yoelii]
MFLFCGTHIRVR